MARSCHAAPRLARQYGEIADRSLIPDLEGDICTVADCLLVADVIGGLMVRVPALEGAIEEIYTLDVPLCAWHAHLLAISGSGYTVATQE